MRKKRGYKVINGLDFIVNSLLRLMSISIEQREFRLNIIDSIANIMIRYIIID